MIILIGGVSCTGKTLMAQNLLKKYQIPYFSMDNLKMGLFRSDANCGFAPTDRNSVIAKKIWPIFKEMIKTIIENNQSIIIEGCYLMPEFLTEFKALYTSKIVSVFLGFSTSYLKENFDSGIIKYRSVIEKRISPEERPVTQFIAEHEGFRDICYEYEVNYFEIKKDYQTEIKEVYCFIDEEVNKILKKDD